jgi:hypothetical protein
MTMSIKSRREYLNEMRQRYFKATSRSEKANIINEVAKVTGYHRKYTIALLN